jgi:predicted membrane channel-forming protein YqfA (hemolysin III family)
VVPLVVILVVVMGWCLLLLFCTGALVGEWKCVIVYSCGGDVYSCGGDVYSCV